MSKGERQRDLAEKMKANATIAPVAPAPAPAPATPAPVPAPVEAKVDAKPEKKADTPAVVPAVVTPDKSKTKRVKKPSGHYSLYRKHMKDVEYPLAAKITVLKKENPKRRGAAVKFALYKDGMTVGEYIDASSAAGTTKRVAMADVKWDQTAGFISVEGVTI
jgi:hypothetical protein